MLGPVRPYLGLYTFPIRVGCRGIEEEEGFGSGRLWHRSVSSRSTPCIRYSKYCLILPTSKCDKPEIMLHSNG
jgi:hypothetical protein